MAIASEASAFQANQPTLYRNWYEKLPYTALDQALPPGEENLFLVEELAEHVPDRLAILSDIATTNTNANVWLRIQGPANTVTQYTAAWPGGLQPVFTAPGDGVRSTSKLGLQWVNNTTAALTSPYQANYAVAVKQLTTADRLVRGLPVPPGSEDADLVTLYQLTQTTVRPMSLTEMLDRIWRRAIVSEEVWTTVTTVGTEVLNPPRISAPAGTVLVLHRIAAAVPSGSVGNLVQLTLDRDGQQGLVTMLLDNAPGLNQPWDVWVTAAKSWQPHLVAATATNNVTVRIEYYRVRLTALLDIIVGNTDIHALRAKPNKTLAEQQVVAQYNQIRAGVVL